MSAIPEQLRRQVESRAGGRCEYCRLPREGQVAKFPVDHVVPRTNDGQTILSNLALACPHCNAYKWAFLTGIDPTTQQSVPLFNPRLQIWSEHFRRATHDQALLEGTTPTGRATIDRLKMNASEMVVVRRLLAELGIPVT